MATTEGLIPQLLSPADIHKAMELSLKDGEAFASVRSNIGMQPSEDAGTSCP